MNYLAHAYLSFNEPHILVGNMISDFVKGRQKLVHAASVQKGMELHRAIDAFTDDHPATLRAKEFFRPAYRLYSAPIMDVVYDHFLANDDAEFSEPSLLAFSETVYRMLEAEAVHLPPRFLPVLAYMRTENWLYRYRTRQGIRQSLRGLVRRAAFLTDSGPAEALLEQHYGELQACYAELFPAVKQMAKQKLAGLQG